MLAPGDLAGELERRLDGVRPRRAGEHHRVVESPRLEDELFEGLEELPFGRSLHVERVEHGPRLQVLDERGHHGRVVVPVVERAGTGEEVEVLLAVLVPLLGALSAGEGRRPRTRVSAHRRFAGLEDVRGGLGRRISAGRRHRVIPFDC
ncbi:Uncharacterised protein [Mycobacteroides abscessus subsp. abscessus]|nr:Uncharacterised protein [Mycobacteroides abscessus subsp. abscessus]